MIMMMMMLFLVVIVVIMIMLVIMMNKHSLCVLSKVCLISDLLENVYFSSLVYLCICAFAYLCISSPTLIDPLLLILMLGATVGKTK